jgi:membrane associated rhomboid family serine protease
VFPLKSLPDPRRKPFCTWILVALNVLAFVAQGWMRYGRGVDAALAYGVIPGCYPHPSSCGIGRDDYVQGLGLPLLTSMFLHADLLHLGFNMLFLWVFGSGLEDRVGRPRFLLIYFMGGLAAAATHIVTHLHSALPVIGASGAIAAVLGAYLIMLPKSWVLTYFPPIFFFPVPAPVFLILWAVAQVWSAVRDIHIFSTSYGGGVAWMAHVGGFAVGALYGWQIAPWFKKRRSRSSRTAVY